jgi:AraC family transcriptional activator of pobA
MHKTKTVKQLAFNEDVSLGFEIIPIDSHYARSKRNLQTPHRAAFYAIIWFESGSPVHLVDFNPAKVKPDSFLFIRKDAVQFFDQHNAFKSRVLIFTDAFFCGNENDNLFLQNNALFNDFGGINNISSTPLMKSIWAQMENEAKQPPDLLQSGLLKNYLSSFMLLAERERQRAGFNPVSPGIGSDYLLAFKNHLERDFRSEKSVGYYAGKMFISAKVLTNAIQQTMGKTPKQLIDERVVLEAKRLLVHGNSSAKSIGLSLGFDEPTNFNKYFKKHTGKTPSEFKTGFSRQPLHGAKVSSLGADIPL